MVALERLFAYDAWANAESLKAVGEAGAPPPALRLMAHVAAAGDLWRGRLLSDPSPVAVWPDESIDETAGRLDRQARQWPAFLVGRPAVELARSVPYVNSKGESWSTSVEDILLHVVFHAAYHRGQVAHVLRAGGATTAYTDYVHCIRSGLLE